MGLDDSFAADQKWQPKYRTGVPKGYNFSANNEDKPVDPRVYVDHMQGEAENRASTKYYQENKFAGEYIVKEMI